MRKTKIVCTLGPATDDEKILGALFERGMNVARMNFSHGTHEEHGRRIDLFKQTRRLLSLTAGLLMDIKGPAIRVKKFKDGKIFLKEGELFTITTDEIEGDASRVSVTYKGLPGDIYKGDSLLLDDGLLELRVERINGSDIETIVITGGELSNSKKINVPSRSIKLPFVSETDRSDLKFGVERGFDFVAASFTRNSSDIKDLKRTLKEFGGENMKIIAKIENREGVDNIDDIIRVSDGIMVARGDMGVEIPFEELPAIQKMIIKKSSEAGKPVITATQMLDSMIRNPRPTRAEITDVANAIYDGTSAIMLSGETSVGKYPAEAVLTMSKIAVETEKNIDYSERFRNRVLSLSNNVTNAVSHSACVAAETLGAAAIIAVTQSGRSARMVSRYRPDCPIIASTMSEDVAHQLSISWGVIPVLTGKGDSTDEIFDLAVKSSVEAGLLGSGDLVILAGGSPAGVSGTTNTMKVHIVGDTLVKGRGMNRLKATANLFVADGAAETSVNFSAGDIIVLAKTEEWMIPILKYASAIITEEQADDSQAAVVGRALDIPVIVEAAGAVKILKSGTVVTADAEKGSVSSGSSGN